MSGKGGSEKCLNTSGWGHRSHCQRCPKPSSNSASSSQSWSSILQVQKYRHLSCWWLSITVQQLVQSFSPMTFLLRYSGPPGGAVNPGPRMLGRSVSRVTELNLTNDHSCHVVNLLSHHTYTTKIKINATNIIACECWPPPTC